MNNSELRIPNSKLKMHTPSLADEHFAALAALFPNAVTETIDDNGAVVRAIDKDVLMQEISAHVVEGREERYQFTWPDKKKSVLLANAPIAAALRPCREESVNFDTTENLYIEGDNLDVLKLLRETYLGRVKMIYIDPPYNTSNDFIYEDDFSESASSFLERDGQYDEQGNRLVLNTNSKGRFHTDWLNMIFPRLRIARDLLADDGVIFISIGDEEVENLRKVCNEIFGEENFVTNLVWQSTAGSNTGTDIVTVTENIIVYTKNRRQFCFDGMPINEENFALSDEYLAVRGRYSLDKLDRRRVGNHYSDALNYPIVTPDGALRYPGGTPEKSNEGWNYLWSRTKVEWGIANGFIVFKQDENGWSVYNKRYSKVDNNGQLAIRTTPYRNLITSDLYNTAQGTSEIRQLFDCRTFDFPKPSGLIKHILSTAVASTHDAIILDFFSGSATSAHAVMQLNAEDGGHRKFIMVQLPEVCAEGTEAAKAGYKNICEIGKERIRRAGAKINSELGIRKAELKSDNSELRIPNSALDIGFRVLKLDSSNMKDVYYTPDALLTAVQRQRSIFGFMDNIKEDRSPEDLLFQVLLDLGIPLSSPIRKAEFGTRNCTVFDVADGYLLACFEQVDTDLITAIARLKPYYAVFRDSSFISDSAMVNFEQVFNTYSPSTIRRVL